MSYLPPSEAGFFEAVQVYFTELTGRMALFGARDQEILEKWKSEGRSARVVCRGIQRAVASRGEDEGPPRSVYQCRGFVDDEWERVKINQVGRHDSDAAVVSTREESAKAPSKADEPVADSEGQKEEGGLLAQARAAIEDAGRAADEERWRQAYRQAWRELNQLKEEEQEVSFSQLQAVDAALVEAYLDGLDEEERRLIEEAVASTSAGLARGMSGAARREHLLVQQKRALVEQFGLLDLMNSLF